MWYSLKLLVNISKTRIMAETDSKDTSSEAYGETPISINSFFGRND